MKIVTTGGQAEIVEKKSRFIAQVFPVQTSEEAYADLAAVRKQYWDARHSCHAFVIGPNNETAHSSDDGEPQGTAGKPILQVLTGSEIRDCLIVVTRYFGGVLLGTGGLVRAYTQAAKAGLDASEISSRQDGWLLTIRCSYEQLGKIQYLISAASCPVTSASYTDVCDTEVLVPTAQLPRLKAALTEKTAGKASFPKEISVRYVTSGDGSVLDITPLESETFSS